MFSLIAYLFNNISIELLTLTTNATRGWYNELGETTNRYVEFSLYLFLLFLLSYYQKICSLFLLAVPLKALMRESTFWHLIWKHLTFWKMFHEENIHHACEISCQTSSIKKKMMSLISIDHNFVKRLYMSWHAQHWIFL